MAEDEKQPARPRTPGHLDREEERLWRYALWLLVVLAAGLAVLSWQTLEKLPWRLGAVPIGLLVLCILFAVYAYGRRREVSELKVLLHQLHDRVGAAPSEEQLDQLSQVIMRSQRSFKELIDSFDDVAFAISLDGTLRTVNRRVVELLGTSYNDVVGHKLDEFVQEPLRSDAESGLGRFLEKRRWSGLVQVRVKNTPRVLYFDCVLNAILKGDEVVGVSALARDVTEEREKERRFTELFETLQEGVYFSTPEGKLLDANPALVQMLGYESKDELLRLEPTALNPDANQSPVLGRTLDDKGGVRTREITLRRKDGRDAIFLDTSRAVWDSSGKIIRYQGTLVDVTERRKMEKAIRRQEEFQRYLLESFPDLILVIDLDERYSFVSSRLRDLLGYRPEELSGKKVETAQEQSPEFLALCREVSSGRKMFGFCEYGARHRDGSWRTMRASASPLFDAESKLSGVIVSVRDITVEKKLEQQIIQSERLAAMGQMIGGFAHELNNPLTSILGVTELLQEGEATESVRKHLAMLQQQTRRAAEIVQNLMYFSRPPSPGKGPINLSELVQRTLHLHAYSLRRNSITVDFLPDNAIPPVSGDPHQLMQVFLNLILNAEQAIREVRDKGTLRIRLGRAGNTVTASFQDDGPGIPPDILPNIFDPFYTTKRPGRGTGLGLSICKAILKEHGGNVEVASGPGGGAVFTVTLPAASAATPPGTSAV
ncbi:MAG TPA: PAS domain S-box protein [Terriglobales bacterium]|jgi:two-component system NtrC family sensor kinase|nr:PAS domain S-box protein [Terriglobales bacterium]